MEKFLPVLISLLALSGLFMFNLEQTQETAAPQNIELLKKYQAWKSEYGMNFNGSEDDYRFAIFRENNQIIEEHNAKSANLVLGHTQFGAMTQEEYKAAVNLHSKTRKFVNYDRYVTASGNSLPDQVDWVSKGAVYQTQDQGHCGSCWSFATIGGLQGLRYITTGKLELLSAQQITSCTPKETLDNKKEGCGGGEAHFAYDYTATHGIELDSSYPYVNGQGGEANECEYDANKVVFYNTGKGQVAPNDPEAMKEALVNQPLSIAVDAGSIFFQFYKQGIIDNAGCGDDLNHAIMMVGYNTNTSEPYWDIQNSWGTGWGQNGFGKVKITEGNGICGINMQVDFPTDINQGPSFNPTTPISQ